MKIIIVYVEFLYLSFIFPSSTTAFPVSENDNAPDLHNRKANLKQKLLLKQQLSQKGSVSSVANDILDIQVPKNFNLSEVEKNLKDFGIHSLKEEKHIEGLPLERDGKFNPDFHKEIFLGHHEMFEREIQDNKNKLDKKLEEIFHEADTNHDNSLSKEELFNYVFKNVQKHLNEAKDKNSQLFILIDTNRDGKVTWNEYSTLYIKFHHMNTTDISDLENNPEILGSSDPNLRRELSKIRFRWTQSDGGGDNELNMDEFLEFRHPEIIGRSYQYMVEDTMMQMDRNEDRKISESEFAFLPQNIPDVQLKPLPDNVDKRWLEQQRQEFHEMDQDHDNFLTKDELIQAFNPMNRIHIEMQITRLFTKVDDSPKDNALSFEELQKHSDIFTNMRLLDADGALHDEM